MNRAFALLLFAASAAFATPTITSVSPSRGPLTGGTSVTIKGTGFSNLCVGCAPAEGPYVSFGDTRAAAVKFIDSTTLEVVTPVYLPATVVILVFNNDGSGLAFRNDAFTFEGDPTEVFDRLLLPIFMPTVRGLFGSEFVTRPLLWNTGTSNVTFYGDDILCTIFDPVHSAYQAQILAPDGNERMVFTFCSRSVGRILWTKKGDSAKIAANLRVADVSRAATGHGTEIPVVRSGNFTTGKIVLLGVPTDPRFRVMLRIYSLASSSSAPVNIEGYGRQVFLKPGNDLFEPSYAEVADLPRTLTRVVIAPSAVPLWAFITVTNNDTQQITTITPN